MQDKKASKKAEAPPAKDWEMPDWLQKLVAVPAYKALEQEYGIPLTNDNWELPYTVSTAATPQATYMSASSLK